MCFSSAVCVCEKRERVAQFPSLFRYLPLVYLSALLPQATTKASESYCAFLYTEHRFIFLLTLRSFSDLGFQKKYSTLFLHARFHFPVLRPRSITWLSDAGLSKGIHINDSKNLSQKKKNINDFKKFDIKPLKKLLYLLYYSTLKYI